MIKVKKITVQAIKSHALSTLMAWAVAFAIVYVILISFGKQLEAMPPALNALVFTGILVPIMGNLVMPVVSKFVGKLIKTRK